jgi:hypothetical protein
MSSRSSSTTACPSSAALVSDEHFPAALLLVRPTSLGVGELKPAVLVLLLVVVIFSTAEATGPTAALA